MAGVWGGRKQRLFKLSPPARCHHRDSSTQLSPPGGGVQSLHQGIRLVERGQGFPALTLSLFLTSSGLWNGGEGAGGGSTW